jgi:capsular polysaccharide biosynthesis protein/GGDEF domain-containing protein
MIRLKMYLQALVQNWWIIVLTVIMAVGATLFLALLTRPIYRTTLQLLIVPNMTDFDGRDLIYSLDTLDQRSIVATYVEIVNSDRIRREAITDVGLTEDEVARYQLTAVALPEANVLELAAEGPDAERVAALANAAAAATLTYVTDTYNIFRLEQLDPANVPQSAISPRPLRDASLALIMGLVLGGVLAIFRDQIRQPLLDSVRHWNANDHASSALTPGYLRHRVGQLLTSNEGPMVMGMIRLEGLQGLELPPSLRQDLLRRVVGRIRDELRGRDLVARWDEISFAIVLRTVYRLEEARQKLESLQRVLSAPIEAYPGGELINLAPRIGAALNQDDDTVSSLVQRVDHTIIQASQNGREPVLAVQETSPVVPTMRPPSMRMLQE